ncbi:MAG: hypothetical protein WCK84_09835, partial [Bacteroidota bacterium]
SLGSQLSIEGERKYGVTAWRDHLEQVEKAWEDVEVEILKKLRKTPFDQVKIYQDGLPVAGELGIKIVKDAAISGSKNYGIIDRLIERGAKLEIAENKDLLLKEYYLLADINKAETPEKQLESYLAYQKMSGDLLAGRDQFVASQINLTLQPGETGIAFFGAAHSILDQLDKEIRVVMIRMFLDEISFNLIPR